MGNALRAVAVGALLALVGCQTIRTTPTALSGPQKAAVESAVRAGLKDPDSARFGRIVAGDTGQGSTLVCGFVNARNGFGGYTGETPFFGFLLGSGRFELRGISIDAGWAQATLSNCRASGIAI